MKSPIAQLFGLVSSQNYLPQVPKRSVRIRVAGTLLTHQHLGLKAAAAQFPKAHMELPRLRFGFEISLASNQQTMTFSRFEGRSNEKQVSVPNHDWPDLLAGSYARGPRWCNCSKNVNPRRCRNYFPYPFLPKFQATLKLVLWGASDSIAMLAGRATRIPEPYLSVEG